MAHLLEVPLDYAKQISIELRPQRTARETSEAREAGCENLVDVILDA